MSGSESQATRMVPPISVAAAPFWDATRRQELVLQWCRTCDAPIHFPREACPGCLGLDLEFRPSAGTGVIYACSVMPRAGNPAMVGREPYVVALIDLDEGVRMMSNVIADPSADPYAVLVGIRVTIAWEPLPDGRHLPVFTIG